MSETERDTIRAVRSTMQRAAKLDTWPLRTNEDHNALAIAARAGLQLLDAILAAPEPKVLYQGEAIVNSVHGGAFWSLQRDVPFSARTGAITAQRRAVNVTVTEDTPPKTGKEDDDGN